MSRTNENTAFYALNVHSMSDFLSMLGRVKILNI